LNEKKTYPKFRRHKFFIKKEFQFNFIIWFILVLFSAALIYGISLYTILDNRLEKGLYSPHLKLRSTIEILGPSLLYVNLAIFLILAIISVIVIVFISRKVQDPFNRLKIDAMRVQNGNLTIEESPKTGHLAVLVGENFIKAIKDIRERIIKLKDSTNALEMMTEKLKLLAELKEPSMEKAKEIIANIESKKGESDKILSQFRTD
jgi:methyl-accepting chemotaxis protein